MDYDEEAEETTMALVSILGAERGCQARVRYLESVYDKMYAKPVPLHGAMSLVDFLKERPNYFDVRPNRIGGYQVFLTEFPHDQAETMAKWNMNSRQRKKSLFNHFQSFFCLNNLTWFIKQMFKNLTRVL